MKRNLLVGIYLSACMLFSASGQTGSLDADFGNGDGLVSTSYFNEHHAKAYAIAVQEDGHILVGGSTRTPVGTEQAVINRYMPDGTPDLRFDEDGVKTITISGHADGLRSMDLNQMAK